MIEAVGPGGLPIGTRDDYDVAVIGAGVFGAWTAWWLRRAGRSVALLDAYGPANSRSSSGGESRIIRMGYGANSIYTLWSMRSLTLWKEFFLQIHEPLFHRTGVLWLAREDDPYSHDTLIALQEAGVTIEKMTRPELETRYPQIDFGAAAWGMLEPESGALMARRAVQRVVEETVRNGADYYAEVVGTPIGGVSDRLESLTTRGNLTIRARDFIFACGPWLPNLFPKLLADRIRPTRQEVFFFGVEPGDRRFAPPLMPSWIDFSEEIYGIPDLESRGLKIGLDRHGPLFDPDTAERVVSAEGLATARAYVARRLPALRSVPLLESRVCQYENTSNGDFLIDRHPGWENVWLVGGGSGHGFKHGPALGEYVAARVLDGGAIEPRFTLASKETIENRAVY